MRVTFDECVVFQKDAEIHLSLRTKTDYYSGNLPMQMNATVARLLASTLNAAAEAAEVAETAKAAERVQPDVEATNGT